MHVGVFAIDSSEDFLVWIGHDSYRMTKNADDPLNVGNCLYVDPSLLPSPSRQVDLVPIGIVKQIAYILRRDCQLKIDKSLSKISDYLDDDVRVYDDPMDHDNVVIHG